MRPLFKYLRLVPVALVLCAAPALGQEHAPDADQNERDDFMSLVVGPDAAFSQKIASDFARDEEGSTRTKGEYSLDREGEIEGALSKVRIQINFRLERPAGADPGKGVVAFMILDADFKPVFQFYKGMTVGAANPQRPSTGYISESAVKSGDASKKILDRGVYASFYVDATKDSVDADDWKSSVSDWDKVAEELKDLGVGDLKEAGKWRFKKIK